MIPWAALLRHAPAIVAAADALLTRAGSAKGDDAPRSLEERLGRLEQSSRDSAEVLHDIATQINALTVAQDRTARRARRALACAIVAAAAAIGALLLVAFA